MICWWIGKCFINLWCLHADGDFVVGKVRTEVCNGVGIPVLGKAFISLCS